MYSHLVFPFYGAVSLCLYICYLPLLVIYRAYQQVAGVPPDPLQYPVEAKGKIVLITGGNTGIGFATAKRLCSLGARVFIACRDVSKGEQAVRSFSGDCSVLHLDLNDISSVAACAHELQERTDRLDVLINNAGLNAPALDRATGLQQLFLVNYLAHFYLFTLLAPLLCKSQGRVVNLSSVTHHFGSDVKYLHRSAWNKHTSRLHHSYYADSKFYLTLLTIAINTRYAGKISAVAVNPGAVRSDIWRGVPFPFSVPYDLFMRLCYLSTDEGCATSVYAAVANIQNYYDFIRHHPSAHPQLPYLVPYYVISDMILFEMIAGFAGPQWAAASLPQEPLNAADVLWEFSSDLIRKICDNNKTSS